MIEIALIAWRFVSGGLGKLLEFFTTKPGIYVGALLLAAGVIWYTNHAGYARGVAVTKAEELKMRLIAERDAYVKGLAFQQRLDKSLADIEFNAGEAKGREEAKTITVIKEIPKYVTVETDRNFPLPCGLLRLHDAAALGIPPEAISLPTGFADDKACPVKASVLADIVAENYGLYHVAQTQIEGLQDLARTLKFAIENPQ